MGLLAPTASAAMEVLGVERIDAVADMGYHKGEDIEACEACEAVGVTPYIPRPHRGVNVSNGLFPKALCAICRQRSAAPQASRRDARN